MAQDPAGNLKAAKDKSTERIDGIVAIVMAIGRAMVAQEEESRRTEPSGRGEQAMTRSLALIAALAFGVSSGVAFAAGDCGSYHVSTSSTTVASADGQSAPSTQIQVPKQKGG